MKTIFLNKVVPSESRKDTIYYEVVKHIGELV